MNQHDKVAAFRLLHRQPQPLVLPNAWDAGSARVIEHAGAAAIASTSAGVSWALGRRDGHGLARGPAVETIRSMVDTVSVPVTADVEGGYGEGTPEDVAETVAAILEAGAVGINLEDGPGRGGEPLLPIAEQTERIRAAREAARARGVDLFINARTDVYLRGVGEPAGRLEAVQQRAAAYLEAGADGLFVPAVIEADAIAALAAGIEAPLNVMAGPGAPAVRDLARLGVARVSLGPALALGSLAFVGRAAAEILEAGHYQSLAQGIAYPEVNGLFADD